jgi:hypothetical protein
MSLHAGEFTTYLGNMASSSHSALIRDGHSKGNSIAVRESAVIATFRSRLGTL